VWTCVREREGNSEYKSDSLFFLTLLFSLFHYFRAISDGRDGTYYIPNYGPTVFAGLQGFVTILQRIRYLFTIVTFFIFTTIATTTTTTTTTIIVIIFSSSPSFQYHHKKRLNLNDERAIRQKNEMGHPFFDHLRTGNWPMDYIKYRLRRYAERTKNTKFTPILHWLEEYFDAVRV
jgi:hypothetical protein